MDKQGDTEIVGDIRDMDEGAQKKAEEHDLSKKASNENPEEGQMMAEIRKAENGQDYLRASYVVFDLNAMSMWTAHEFQGVPNDL